MNFKSYDSANIPSLDLNNIITIYYVCYKNCDNMEVFECISSLIFFWCIKHVFTMDLFLYVYYFLPFFVDIKCYYFFS